MRVGRAERFLRATERLSYRGRDPFGNQRVSRPFVRAELRHVKTFPRLVRIARAGIIAARLGILLMPACGSAPASPTGTPLPPSAQPPTAGTPVPLEGATISITNRGFSLDTSVGSQYTIDTLRVYQGGRLTFVNQDAVAHDIQSGPPHIHTDCPEIGGAGFLLPGQTRSTDPLDRLVSCTFHDHHYETDPRFSGRVTVERR
jgi:hypothetical protein